MEEIGTIHRRDDMIEEITDERDRQIFKIGDKVKWFNKICRVIETEDTEKNGQLCLIKQIDPENNGIFKWVRAEELDKTCDFLEINEPDSKRNVNDICDDILIDQKTNKCSVISLKSDVCDNEIEIILNNYEIEVRDGKTYAILKKKKYPQSYEECCKVLGIVDNKSSLWHGYRSVQLKIFQKLIICRDAYWKLAGDEMGLGNPWEPDYSGTFWNGTPIKYVIYNIGTHIVKEKKSSPNHILSFPTIEMRDAFYENFKDLIEDCKELL